MTKTLVALACLLSVSAFAADACPEAEFERKEIERVDTYKVGLIMSQEDIDSFRADHQFKLQMALERCERIAAERNRLQAEEEASIAKEAARIAAKRRLPNIALGMTREQVQKSRWGAPDHINRTTTQHGVREQWVYRGGGYLYFVNGRLTVIQD